MELKLRTVKEVSKNINLLIVPYGIETSIGVSVTSIPILLIVPYGIETYLEIISIFAGNKLLIVPYGIETL